MERFALAPLLTEKDPAESSEGGIDPLGVLDALKANFSSITLHQVMMTRVPAEQISGISVDACKRKTIKHHYG